jgi:protein-S-isoprenylcysteine O-methyltransferase Ste14
MDMLLRVGFFVVALAMMAVRFTWARRAEVMAPGVKDVDEGAWLLPIRALFVPIWLGVLGLYLLRPETLAPVTLALPMGLRLGGLVVAAAGVALLAWVHQTLGVWFSHRLRIREGHALIMTGPYKAVRHPMYTAFLMISGGLFLSSALLPIGVVVFGGVIAVVWSRTPREERMLMEAFGEEYRRYAARSGMLFPRLR